MAHQILLTTTGDVPSFRLPDLGIGFDHPVADFDLLASYKPETLRDSGSLQNAMNENYCTLKDGYGEVITNISDFLYPRFEGEDWDQYASAESDLSVTSDEWYQVLRLQVTPPVTADYRICWYAEVATDNITQSYAARVQVDESTIGRTTDKSSVADKHIAFSGFKEMELDDTTHNIDFDIRAWDVGVTVEVRRVRLHIERS
jgi:hypothetical protein